MKCTLSVCRTVYSYLNNTRTHATALLLDLHVDLVWMARYSCVYACLRRCGGAPIVACVAVAGGRRQAEA